MQPGPCWQQPASSAVGCHAQLLPHTCVQHSGGFDSCFLYSLLVEPFANIGVCDYALRFAHTGRRGVLARRATKLFEFVSDALAVPGAPSNLQVQVQALRGRGAIMGRQMIVCWDECGNNKVRKPARRSVHQRLLTPVAHTWPSGTQRLAGQPSLIWHAVSSIRG